MQKYKMKKNQLCVIAKVIFKGPVSTGQQHQKTLLALRRIDKSTTFKLLQNMEINSCLLLLRISATEIQRMYDFVS